MEKLKIGTIVRGFGIKGEVKIKILTDVPEDRFKVKRKLIAQCGGQELILTVTSLRFHQDHALVSFAGYPDLTSVEPLVGASLWVKVAEIDTSMHEGFYSFQLIGLQALDLEGNLLGVVSEVMPTNANDVLRIKTLDKDILVPYLPVFVKEVDLIAKTIKIMLLEGMR
ncbi:MAG: 16S rRNA processing protein RimM [Erysipelotrichales bacterium]|nr:MAG: 16S rRNA processing protein RimM [Erysipelotrichales bacterium]